jgi:hypothetical protein
MSRGRGRNQVDGPHSLALSASSFSGGTWYAHTRWDVTARLSFVPATLWVSRGKPLLSSLVSPKAGQRDEVSRWAIAGVRTQKYQGAASTCRPGRPGSFGSPCLSCTEQSACTWAAAETGGPGACPPASEKKKTKEGRRSIFPLYNQRSFSRPRLH